MGRRQAAINMVKAITPPIIWRGIVKAYMSTQPVPPPPPKVGFFGDYATFDAALADCGADYEAGDYLAFTRLETLEIKGEKTNIHPWWMPMMLAMQTAIFDLAKPTIKVLDFGGALGAHYFEVRRVIPKSVVLDWTVVELPGTVTAGAEFANDDLHFVTDMALVKDPDIVLASCVFQALPRPYECLRALLAIGAPHVVLPLIPMRGSDRDRLTVQFVGEHIANIQVPTWFFSQSFFTAIMRQAGHTIFSAWRTPEYTNRPDGEPVCEYFGFHLRPPTSES